MAPAPRRSGELLEETRHSNWVQSQAALMVIFCNFNISIDNLEHLCYNSSAHENGQIFDAKTEILHIL